MTPLPWWVFLATLLGRAIGVPIHEEEDASVRFCRTLGTSEVCDLQTLAFLRSYERHVGRRDELARCFISCEEDEDSWQGEERKEFCEKTKKDFVWSGRCGCLGPVKMIQSKYLDGSEKENSLWIIFEDILKRYQRYIQEIGSPGTLDLVNESENSLEQSVEIRMKLKLDESGDFEIIEEEEEKEAEAEEEEEKEEMGLGIFRKVATFDGREEEKSGKVEDHAVTTIKPASSEEHVDWEMWCMTQCDHGQGGTACNCDIIP